MKRFLHLSIIAPLLVCGACASGGSATPPSAAAAEPTPAAHQHEAAKQQEHQAGQHHLPATPGPGYTAADVRFMQNMIGHHVQALVMTAMAPTHGAGDRLLRLAEKIDISQRDEIALMEQWLTDRNQALPSASYMDHMMMPGMLSPEQLAQLDAARGHEFERLFLTFMIRHHEGALQMVEELFDTPRAGQDPDIFRFATDVDADQRDEIYVMRTMLATLDDNPGSPAR